MSRPSIKPLDGPSRERGAAALLIVLMAAVLMLFVLAIAMENSKTMTVTTAQISSYNQARALALAGVRAAQYQTNTILQAIPPPPANNCMGTCYMFMWWPYPCQVPCPTQPSTTTGTAGVANYFAAGTTIDATVSNQQPFLSGIIKASVVANTFSSSSSTGQLTVLSQGFSGQCSATVVAILAPPVSATSSTASLVVASLYWQ